MANYANILAEIAAAIYSNDAEEITGDVLQQVGKDSVDSPKSAVEKKRRQRHNELVGGGHFVFCRGGRTGRIKTGAIMAGKIPFEHPTLESATAEAIRLSELHGRSFVVLSQIVVVYAEGGAA